MTAKTLGERLRTSRRNANLTQQQVADRVGVTRSLISQWENGEVEEIGAHNLFLAARALGVSIDWILEGDSVRELPAVYDELSELRKSWQYLTTKQRTDLVRHAEELADHNRALLSELFKNR